ncbi:MmgE/PrpD family protein [Nitrospiraceae bacterium AH_259_D15_M11_P09]|nr:MmgE/PrpD family protein [Nitrospiraceae bacterium AH_259_D15_M11_P09]
MIADRLADYTQTLCYDHLPADVVHEVKRRTLDSLGCALGAWNAAPCKIARRLAQSVKLSNGSTLWGTTHKTLPDLAAFANGALVRYLDFNDTYLSKEPAHPSDNIAAAVAVGETAHASGHRVIQAIALAYEVQCRLCDAAALRPRGWDHVTYGPFSSALAAAKVLKLSTPQTVQAVNLAGVANVALRQTRVGDLSMWKACAFSNAARNGVFAAMLAKQGMTGPSPIFEGEKGFMKLVSGGLDLQEFGGRSSHKSQKHSTAIPFKILDTYIKQYPVEYHAQTAVEATLIVREELLKAEGPQALEQIIEVEVGSYDVAIEIIGRDPEKWHPQTRETADHSFPYCVAVALLDGHVSFGSFADKRLADPALRALMQKVRVVEQQEFVGWYPEAMPTRVTVRTAAGKEYVKQNDFALGHPRNPMSDREVEEKFRLLTARSLDRAQAGKVIEAVWKLETLSDIGRLMPLLKVRRGSSKG